MTMTAYRELEQRFRRLNALGEAAGVLHWDMSTVMPTGGATARSEQLAALDVTCHELLEDPRLEEMLDRAEQEAAALDSWQAANLREMRRQWRRATALDGALVEALSKTAQSCQMTWREARPESDFAGILPELEALLGLVREKAQALAEALGCSPYDALLDEYAPGCDSGRVDALFAELAGFLPDLIAGAFERQAAGPVPVLPAGPFPLPAQEALVRRLMQGLGFDFKHGRLDISLHPFCGGVPDDVRITTRYEEDDFLKAQMAVLHESGHALYERGLPAAWRLQPVGAAGGMVLHESQSLLIEMQVCRGADFLAYAAPLMRDAFGGEGPAWQAENLLRLSQKVERGFIRVDADEVTYPAHVVLRYRLERSLLEGKMALDELPDAWNRQHEELLGIVPPNDRLGCLQDIHWFDGAWGYFPTYTLGAMAAAQFFQAALRDLPEIPEALRSGDFRPLMTWLRAHVHELGSHGSTDAVLQAATGAPLGATAFRQHLEARYLG